MSEEAASKSDFIRTIVAEDVASGKWDGRIATRFPPEPNGYLTIGHTKAIHLSYSIAQEFGGTFHLRFDDTNPTKEDFEFVDAIQHDMRWLGFDWGDHLFFASDTFEQLYEFACQLIRQGDAFVCDLSPEEMREYRGTLTEPGRNSPHRDRSVEENLDLFQRMRAGEFSDGERVLRAKIDMTSPNINLRDPVLYRIQRAPHYRLGDAWCIYPTYDYTHPIGDSLEKITHSLCTVEFENHRPLYDWVLDKLGIFHSQQIEFGKLRFGYTVLSKRNMRAMVSEGIVNGWDDPRLPTIAGVRRRGYPPAALREMCNRVGVGKKDESRVDLAVLEHCVRDELNRTAPRVMAVLDPVKLVIENYPEGEVEHFPALNNPEDESAGTRDVPFSRELWVERDDFREDPPRKYHRLSPGKEVRLRSAYLVTCTGFEKDADGNVTEIRCTYDPDTRGGDAPDGRKVRGTLHWVSAPHALEFEARLYDRLFLEEAVETADDFREHLNPDSLEVRGRCYGEPSLADLSEGDRVQFERLGYFCADPDTTSDHLVMNRTVSLRDTWAKLQKKG